MSIASTEALQHLGTSLSRTIRAREDSISEVDDPREINLLVEGWACRYKLLEDGRRQIMTFFILGDIADVHIYILHKMDHSIGTITKLKIG